jgi:hypothetical protein
MEEPMMTEAQREGAQHFIDHLKKQMAERE